jgi:hypothetical protein
MMPHYDLIVRAVAADVRGGMGSADQTGAARLISGGLSAKMGAHTCTPQRPSSASSVKSARRVRWSSRARYAVVFFDE